MAKDIKTYYEQSYIDNTLRLREVLQTLPSFTKDYFRAVEPTTSAKTRISYAYDIRVFFHFLIENNPNLSRLYNNPVYPSGLRTCWTDRYRGIFRVFKGI